MNVFELIGTSAWIDWSSRGSEKRIGLFSNREKAEAKILELKSSKDWKMGWKEFNIVEVEVK
jgi:hypothetical protein